MSLPKYLQYEGGALLGDIRDYAENLNVGINFIIKQTGAEKVDIVSHSMGGLVARQYIQTTGKNSVGKLIMVGTPNYGTYMPVYLTLFLDFLDFKYPKSENTAFYQMMPGSRFLNNLNNNYAENRTNYTWQVIITLLYSSFIEMG